MRGLTAVTVAGLVLSLTMLSCSDAAKSAADAGDAAPPRDLFAPDAASDKGQEYNLTLGFIEATLPGPQSTSPVVGASVTVYAESNLQTPVASGLTDSKGIVQLVATLAEFEIVVHAKKDGYRDTWLFSDVLWIGSDVQLIPQVPDSRWLSSYTDLGETELPETGIVVAGSFGWDLVRTFKTSVDSGGKVFYFDKNGTVDKTATSGSRSIVVNVPVGQANVYFDEQGQLTGERTVRVFPGALSVAMIWIN
jgi:hypothetical protein